MPARFGDPINGRPLIEMRGVSKTYVNAAGEFQALRDIHLTFYEGEFVGVIGKSGSGKSTLVNMITGIDRPTGGQVLIDGVDVHALRESKQARWRGLNLGVVFQFFQLLPMLTLLENVLLPMDFCDKYANGERVDRAMTLLEMVGLEQDAHKLPGAVSGGQQQSAAIARALANDPPIIVADEPTGNLDVRTADSVYDKFESLAGEGRTIIMITHDPEIESRLSRTILISDGEVIDPFLAHALPWVPHPVLRELGVELEMRSFSEGESLTGLASEGGRFYLIGRGRVRLALANANPVTLSQGDYFTGSHVLGGVGEVTARVLDGPAELAWLPWNRVVTAFREASLDVDRFLREVRSRMRGEDRPEDGKEGLIQ
jgi:putative ABC transport system ATP-binding protein